MRRVGYDKEFHSFCGHELKAAIKACRDVEMGVSKEKIFFVVGRITLSRERLIDLH